MSNLVGNQVTIPNYYARLILIVFSGIVAFAAIILWRGQLLVNAEYVDFPTYRHTAVRDGQAQLQQQLNQ